MALKTKCNGCKRESKEIDYWWEFIERDRRYFFCPSCYRNKSLIAYRDTLLERIKDIQLSHSEPDIKMGMEMMRNRCEAIVRDTVFNV